MLRVWLPAAAGVGVAVVLGVYARLHTPVPAGFLDVRAKVWLASAAAALALLQLLSALSLYGRLPAFRGNAATHRWTGRLAVLVSLPMAVHCLYVLGFSTAGPRTLAHSVFGCLFYGAFVTKMLLLSSPRATRPWLLPLLGGLVLTTITGLWLTSAFWFLFLSGTP
ncbi:MULTISPECIES: DUF6529 family protein [Actinoplanes]|uniref:DUF6529 family protein n=1 Tax=Actinoplanes TaxID=1865 RepID=UPI0005F2C055|nr:MULTISPECIES: DUF6529 family protein [Actinoplanes]GLY06284.1 hypothetical protein Acsp01_66630 [Actinoplanes sp. NBRC 101535]